MRAVSFLVALNLFLVSCATYSPAPKLDHTKVDFTKEGIFYGKMKISLDDKFATGQCNLKFEDGKISKFVNVDKEGNFEGSMPSGKIYLSEIECERDSYYFDPNVVFFTSKLGKKKTFVGEIDVKWSPGGFNPIVTILGALIGWIAFSKSGSKITLTHENKLTRKVSSTKTHFVSLMEIPYGLGPKVEAKK